MLTTTKLSWDIMEILGIDASRVNFSLNSQPVAGLGLNLSLASRRPGGQTSTPIPLLYFLNYLELWNYVVSPYLDFSKTTRLDIQKCSVWE